MKKSLTVKILEILGEGLMTATDVVTSILESGYGSSYSKMDRNFRRLEYSRIDRINEARERQRFYNLISKLKREGLVAGKTRLKITAVGREKVLKSKGFDVKFGRYEKEKDDTVKIVIFDIPEKDRHKRDWLRVSLSRLGFKMLQKSVWMGKVKIPEEFLEDLRFIRISQYVHIFSAEKLGTIDLTE
ncbi:MAG: CRISPR-associated endonuclease Cas2 [Candidatus Liptonbacteria bacterium]|nr:CRISPR-associated endonuclease Cas2 [Candidatus Liptonbacteria bacterium]